MNAVIAESLEDSGKEVWGEKKSFHVSGILEKKKNPPLNGNLSALKVICCCQGEEWE